MKEIGCNCACQGATLTRFVQPIILYSLAQAPCHGYDLMTKISQSKLWGNDKPDKAGVYRALRDMEQRQLIISHMDENSKASIGKRVFEITDLGLSCMGNWVDTLENYSLGIAEVINNLNETLKITSK